MVRYIIVRDGETLIGIGILLVIQKNATAVVEASGNGASFRNIVFVDIH